MAFDRPGEAWLEIALGQLDAHQDRLRDGVYFQASLLLRSLECGPISYPDISVSDRCYRMQWRSTNGCRLTVTVVGLDVWRYRRRNAKGKSSGLQTVRGNHCERFRRMIAELYPNVNDRFANTCLLKGEW